MDKKLKRSYNKTYKQYRFQRANIDKENWHTIFFPEKVAIMNYEQNLFSDIRLRAYPYKFYFLRSFFWFFKSNISKPMIRLTKTETMKKIIIGSSITIIGAIGTYAIMKFILHWIK